MSHFPYRKPSSQALSSRKPIFGIGINDAAYVTNPMLNGNKLMCPYYARWYDMIKRCYSATFHKKHPAYIGCTVTNDWLIFSNFRKWMDRQEWLGMELDKDIKIKGNKTYSPDTCLFIPKSLNLLLNTQKNRRGKYPLGVNFNNKERRYAANISNNGKLKKLGRFKTQQEAVDCYCAARREKFDLLIAGNAYPVATKYLSQHI